MIASDATPYNREKPILNTSAPWNAFFRNAAGTVAVEYAVIAGAMFLALIPGFIYVSSGIRAKFEFLIDYFDMF